MYSLVSQASAPTNTIDIIGSSKQALSSSSTLLLSSSASQSRSSLEQSSSSRATARTIIKSSLLYEPQNHKFNGTTFNALNKRSPSPPNHSYIVRNNNIDDKKSSLVRTIVKQSEDKGCTRVEKISKDREIEKSCHDTVLAATVASRGDGQNISSDTVRKRALHQPLSPFPKTMSDSFINYATSLNSVSSSSPSCTSVNSSLVGQTNLANHLPNSTLTAASSTSTASMAAAMFYQQQQAAGLAAAGFDAAAVAAANLAGNPSGHHQGPLASAAATAALANSVGSEPRYPWMSITGTCLSY